VCLYTSTNSLVLLALSVSREACVDIQVLINCNIVSNMTFTKTSQKFGQWTDPRANTVYGLGFASEADLNKVGNNTLLNVSNLNTLKHQRLVSPKDLCYDRRSFMLQRGGIVLV
jgi:hypothetical protein